MGKTEFEVYSSKYIGSGTSGRSFCHSGRRTCAGFNSCLILKMASSVECGLSKPSGRVPGCDTNFIVIVPHHAHMPQNFSHKLTRPFGSRVVVFFRDGLSVAYAMSSYDQSFRAYLWVLDTDTPECKRLPGSPVRSATWYLLRRFSITGKKDEGQMESPK